MTTKIRDLSIEEFKVLVSNIVRDTVEELLEDIVALSSQEYIKSIEEARKDFDKGDYKTLEEAFDV